MLDHFSLDFWITNFEIIFDITISNPRKALSSEVLNIFYREVLNNLIDETAKVILEKVGAQEK